MFIPVDVSPTQLLFMCNMPAMACALAMTQSDHDYCLGFDWDHHDTGIKCSCVCHAITDDIGSMF